jgi:integrase
MSEQAPAEKPAFTIPFQNGLRCPECGSTRLNKDGIRYLKDSSSVQRYLCKDCGYRFSWPQSGKQPKRQNLKSQHAITLDECSSRALALLEQSVEGAMSNVEEKTGSGPPAGAVATSQISQADIKGKIVEYAFWLQKEGVVSAKNRVAMIKRLADLGANLLDPESVKAVIAKQQTWSSSYKMLVTYAYEGFLKMLGMTWQRPKYKQQQALPFIPTEEELNALIIGVGPKLGTFLQGLKDTGADPGELAKLRWIDVNFQNCTVNIRPVKGHNPRILKVSEEFIRRLSTMPRKGEYIFHYPCLQKWFKIAKKRLARKLNNPRLLKITFTTFRHWKGTMEYHRTHDLLHVKKLLGHKNINSTMVYVNLEQAVFTSTNDEFHVATAKTVEEACKLAQVGFEYFTTIEGVQIFRKRK